MQSPKEYNRDMNIFKTFSLKWWQVGIFKLSLLAVGIAIGAYWSDIFLPFVIALAVVGVSAGAYVWFVWSQE